MNNINKELADKLGISEKQLDQLHKGLEKQLKKVFDKRHVTDRAPAQREAKG
jgi:DNA-binding Xre family transcriptional regulator